MSTQFELSTSDMSYDEQMDLSTITICGWYPLLYINVLSEEEQQIYFDVTNNSWVNRSIICSKAIQLSLYNAYERTPIKSWADQVEDGDEIVW
jgi:hypothetical protein